jgi:chemotaxis protein MotA
MLVIVGSLVVIASVAGGYMSHGGNLMLLYQPSEFVIIGGSALGLLIVGTPMSVIKDMMTQLKNQLGSGPSRQEFTDLVVMLYQLFRVVQATGVMALETHFENPKESSVLSRYPKFLARHSAMSFLSDSAQVIIVGGISPHDFEHLLYEDIEVRHKQNMMPYNTLSKVGDALPGLGIVAAVLGVVITMQAIDGPVTEIGHKVGAALVGTFLGILLSYGFVQPIAAAVEHRVNEELNFEHAIKAGLLAMYKGLPPAIAVEFARRVIPEDVRPTFEETETLCRNARTEAQAAMAA